MAYPMIKKVFNVDFSQNPRAQIKDNSQDTLKVIGAGLPRTGTSSLKTALERLGFDPCHHMSEVWDHPDKSLLFADFITQQSNMSPEESKLRSHRLQRHIAGYLATVDSPGCDVYQDLMALYPEAKVILSVRDSDGAWWKSFSGSYGIMLTSRYGWLTYPVSFLRCNRILVRAMAERWISLTGAKTLGPSIHAAHNEDVRSNVPSEKLLVFNVKMGWKPLCDFLDVPVPEEPFPNINEASTMTGMIKGAQVMGACVWLLYLGLAIPLILAFIRPQYLPSLVRDW